MSEEIFILTAVAHAVNTEENPGLAKVMKTALEHTGHNGSRISTTEGFEWRSARQTDDEGPDGYYAGVWLVYECGGLWFLACRGQDLISCKTHWQCIAAAEIMEMA